MPKILVVDDLRDSADSLALLFDALGHQTMTSYDGQQAVEAAQTFGPDIHCDNRGASGEPGRHL